MATSRRRKVGEPIARGGRTVAHVGLPFAALDLLQQFDVTHLTAGQMGAVITVATPVVAYVHAAMENAGWVPALLRQIPPRKAPIVDDTANAR